MSTNTKSISSIQMGNRLSLRQGTAWFFMQKFRKAMESSPVYPLSELVHVDEFCYRLNRSIFKETIFHKNNRKNGSGRSFRT